MGGEALNSVEGCGEVAVDRRQRRLELLEMAPNQQLQVTGVEIPGGLYSTDASKSDAY
jgi:hypothetical protein